MGEHPTNDPTNPLHRLARDLERGLITPADVAEDVDFALSEIERLRGLLLPEGYVAVRREELDQIRADQQRWLAVSGYGDVGEGPAVFRIQASQEGEG